MGEQKAAAFRRKEVMSLNQGKDSAIYELFDDAIVVHFFVSTNESHYLNNSQSQVGFDLFAQSWPQQRFVTFYNTCS